MHGSWARIGEISSAVGGVTGVEALRNQNLDWSTNEVRAVVAEQHFRLSIHEYDAAVGGHGDERVRRGVEQSPQASVVRGFHGARVREPERDQRCRSAGLPNRSHRERDDPRLSAFRRKIAFEVRSVGFEHPRERCGERFSLQWIRGRVQGLLVGAQDFFARVPEERLCGPIPGHDHPRGRDRGQRVLRCVG
jgi:hypothetical protein